MRFLIALCSFAALLVVLAAFLEASSLVHPSFGGSDYGSGTACVGTPAPAKHCGCVNWKSCTEPCSACCGPHGYDDCFKNPDPTCCSGK